MRARRNILLFSSDAADLSTRRFVYENRLLTIRTWGVSTTHDLCDAMAQVPDPRLAIIVWHDAISAGRAGELLNVGLRDVPLLILPARWGDYPAPEQVGFRFTSMAPRGLPTAQIMDHILSLVECKRGPKRVTNPVTFEMKEAG